MLVQPGFETNDHEQTGVESLLPGGPGKSFSKLRLSPSVPRKGSWWSLVGISWLATQV